MKKLLIFILSLLANYATFGQKVIQTDIQSLLNARIVTTLSNNKLVLWTESLDAGTSGMATQAAVKSNGDTTSIALPDEGVFSANEFHPKVVLNYSNAKATGFQARRSIDVDSFTVVTPKKKYEKVFLFCMSGNGKSNLSIQLIYSDKTVESCERYVPDWFFDLKPTDTNLCVLAKNMGKWDKTNKLMEADHHYIHGVILQPNPSKKLVSISVKKEKEAVLTLWGVTLQTK